MNFRDLHYFLSIGRLQHFGNAAEARHVSQPALSSQIKKLENELGVKLFERNNRSVRLTDAGQALIPLAEQALNILNTIKATANSAAQPFSGTLRLGAIPTIAPYLVPDLFRVTGQTLPQLTIEFDEDITERLTAKLTEGIIDAALIATPIEDPKLEAIELYDEHFWVAFPSHHGLEEHAFISIDDLPADELLLLSEGHCFRDQAADICRIDALNLVRSIRASSLEMLLKMVAVGQGITLVPETAVDIKRYLESGVRCTRLMDTKAYRRVYLAYRKTYPRRQLLDKIAELIVNNAPSQVTNLYLK